MLSKWEVDRQFAVRALALKAGVEEHRNSG